MGIENFTPKYNYGFFVVGATTAATLPTGGWTCFGGETKQYGLTLRLFNAISANETKSLLTMILF